MSRVSTRSQIPDYRSSIGAVLKELRESQRMSRAVLGRATGISVARLGHIECGETCPDDVTVSRLALALDVNAGEIWSRADAVYEERRQLSGFLEDLGIPRENWEEFFALEPKARAALVESLRVRLPSRAERRTHVEAIEDAVERDGLDDRFATIVAGISAYGLSPIDYMRASVELEEMPGDRAVVADRLPISPVSVPVDQLYLFRVSYGMDPPSPTLLKWWAETRRSALDVVLKDHVSRTIVPVDRLEHYLRTGERGPNILLPPDIVTAHLVATIELLRKHPHFNLGLSDHDLPVNYRIKGNHHVLVTVNGYVLGPNPEGRKITLLFSRPSVVKRFNEHFERAWASLAPERKEREPVADCLEQMLIDTSSGGTR